MFNVETICESARRHWLPIVVIVALCVCAGVGPSIVKSGEATLAPSYTAEVSLYVTSYGFQGDAEKDEAYNYSLNENMAVTEVRRIAISDAVAGEVRRNFGEDVSLAVPFWIDESTSANYTERFVFIDATAPDPDVALEAAQCAADLVIDRSLDVLPISDLVLSDGPYLKSSDSTKAADWGVESFVVVPEEQQILVVDEVSGISIKNVVAYVFVGAVLSVFGFAAYDIFSRRVRSSRDIERLLDVPVISELTKGEGYGCLAESLRVLSGRFEIEKLSVVGLCDKDRADLVAGVLSSYEALPELTVAALADDPAGVGLVAETDAVLLVVKCAAARGSQVEQALKLLKIADVPVLGAVYVARK